jgi:hypothetical protein
MFTHTPREKHFIGVSPLSSHNYWKERVRKEIEIKKNRLNTRGFSLFNEIAYANSSAADTKLFTKDLGHMFTSFINSKAGLEFPVHVPKRIKPTTSVNWTRLNNGGHIPVTTTTKYTDLFAKKSYLKPQQLKEDARGLEVIIDDIKTNPRLTYSKKKELIDNALKRK